MAHSGFIWRQAACIGLYLTIAVELGLPAHLHAQSKGTVSQNPVNPLGLSPIRIVNYPQPIHHQDGGGRDWAFTLSESYQFLNQRNRVADVSLDSESVSIDFEAFFTKPPFTSLDISYAYSYASGSSPADKSQTVNQHVGSLRLLQPLLFFSHSNWKSAPSGNPLNQFAVILDANYGSSLSSTETPHLLTTDDSARTFVGSALLDYQFVYSPIHTSDNYVTVFFELSSGVQFNTIRFDSSNRNSTMNSSSRQLTYQNIACFNCSFLKRLGFLVAAEWDAPLSSDPLHGSRPYYANTAVFTAGLTYNYAGLRPTGGIGKNLLSPDHWSLSLLYSYTAFDPFTETNQLQVQVAYSF